MIGRLTGRSLEDADGTLVVECGGVGYEVIAPLGTLGRAKTVGDRPGEVTLYIHTHVREDALVLFGFSDEVERAAFRTLIGVSGIGPKTAVGVLSALPARELARAIAGKELGLLTAVPGVGKKTAERMLLELRDKLSVAAGALPLPASKKTAPTLSDKKGQVAQALVGMGYKAAEAERAAATLEEAETRDVAELLRAALKYLAK
jgi:holliday junction DNA helicase RuvA